jgi:hypothetical protein
MEQPAEDRTQPESLELFFEGNPKTKI